MIDYHVHTDNSYDSKTPMIEMCAQAVSLGVTEIAFTDHFNNHLLDIDLGFYDPKRYFDDIDFCRARFPMLTILAGIEVGEPHRWWRKARPVLESYPYDIVLGSLHWIGNESVFSPNYYRARPPEKAYGAYFAELVRMIEHGGFDVLAHMDLPKRTAYDVYGVFDPRNWEDLIRPVWAACLRAGITPEINTKGWRIPVRQMHPSVDALHWYVDMGGKRLTIGSDAHHPSSIAQDTHIARHMALQAGLTHICRFRERRLVGWTALTA
jgi:histidinol-phosphatase (PHP family)